MPTIIDILLVTRGLDSSKFDEGTKKAGKSTDELKNKTGELNKASKDTKDTTDALSGSFVKFFAIIGAAYELKAFTEDVIQSSDKLGLMATNLGESVSKLNAWSNMAEAAGGSASGLQGTLSMLSKAATEFQITGNTGILKYTQQLGVGLLDVNGKARSSIDVFRDIGNELLARSGGDRQKAFNVGSMMGIDAGSLNLMLKGGAAIDDMLAKQKVMMPITEEQAQQARDLNQAYTEMSQSFDAGGRTFMSAVYPYLMKFANWLTDVNIWMSRNSDKVAQFLPLVGTMAAVYFTPSIVAATLAFMRLTAAFLLSPIGMVTALAGAIYLLWDDYQTWKKGGDSLIDWAKWKPSVDAAIAGVGQLRDIIKDMFGYLNQAGTWLGSKTYDVVQGISKGIQTLGDVIGGGEGGYNSVNLGKKGGYKSSTANLENMSISEVMTAQSSGDFRAAGKYQMMPGTLKEAVTTLGINPNQKFDKSTQDMIFQKYLVGSKRPEIEDYLSGKSDNLTAAAIALAAEFASVADPRTGKSAYPENNTASISADTAMRSLAQARQANLQNNTTSNSQTVTTHVDNLTIHTQATNANDIAANIQQSLQKQGQMVYSADGGLN